MCIRISVAGALPAIAIWDPDEITIFVQRGTHPHDLIREIRAILADLGATPFSSALVCFCGMTVHLPDDLAQRRRLRLRSLIRRQVLRGA